MLARAAALKAAATASSSTQSPATHGMSSAPPPPPPAAIPPPPSDNSPAGTHAMSPSVCAAHLQRDTHTHLISSTCATLKIWARLQKQRSITAVTTRGRHQVCFKLSFMHQHAYHVCLPACFCLWSCLSVCRPRRAVPIVKCLQVDILKRTETPRTRYCKHPSCCFDLTGCIASVGGAPLKFGFSKAAAKPMAIGELLHNAA
jgi:hypothetical protein